MKIGLRIEMMIRRINGERGGNLIEYMFLVLLVLVCAIVALREFGALHSPPLNDAAVGLAGEVPAPEEADQGE